jgi:hypothetical protein
MSRLTYMDGGRRLMDCRNCGQAARLHVHGDRLTVNCFAQCDQDVALEGADVEQLLAEVRQPLHAAGGASAGDRRRRTPPGDQGIHRPVRGPPVRRGR